MRLDRLYAFNSWGQAALESAGLALIAFVVATLLTQHGYEASLTLKPVSTAQTDVAQMVQSARDLAGALERGESVKLGAEIMAPDTLRLFCRAEDASRAKQVCEHVSANLTHNSPQVHVRAARPAEESGMPVPPLQVLAPLTGVLWFGIRKRQAHARRAQLDDELNAWRAPKRREREAPTARVEPLSGSHIARKRESPIDARPTVKTVQRVREPSGHRPPSTSEVRMYTTQSSNGKHPVSRAQSSTPPTTPNLAGDSHAARIEQSASERATSERTTAEQTASIPDRDGQVFVPGPMDAKKRHPKTIMGMPKVRTANEIVLPPMPHAPTRRTEPSTPPQASRSLHPTPVQTLTPSDLARGITLRTVYRVGGNPFQADPGVLSPRTQSQLTDVRDRIRAQNHKVIRLASDVGSRYAKTQVAAQLAVLLAEGAEASVVLVEGDLDAPALHRATRLEPPVGMGFSEQLQRITDQDDSGTLAVMRVEGTLHALVESRNSAPAALGLPAFGEALRKLSKEHQHVVLDGPVVDAWPDAAHLSDKVDAVVLVVAGMRTRDSVTLASTHFRSKEVIGIISAGDWVATG